MDLSYDDAIDTLCSGCGASAAGWLFSSDGRRVYVCAGCATALGRYGGEGEIPDHPTGELCRVCDRPTLNTNLNHQKRCPECRGSAGDRAEQDPGENENIPPEYAAKLADDQGAVEWDEA